MEASGDLRADGRIRIEPVGLTTRLEEYFSRQLDKQQELKGERCPGEESCAERIWMPLFKHRDRPIQEVCGTCRLLPTKPGSQPRELIRAISTACELSDLKECG